MSKENLLTIGEVAKLSGASIHSIRYYERIKVLTPAYTDPDTGYRYYSFDQLHLLEVISFCIEMDIPLKDMHRFTQAGDIVDARAFLNEGKNIAIKKISAIKQSLRFLKDIERQMDIVEKYKPGQIYTRHITEKVFYVHYYPTITGMSPIDLAYELVDMPFGEDESYAELPEYGMMAMHSAGETKYYGFGQVPAHMEGDTNTMSIPAGEYHCILSQDWQIEQAHEIFRELVSDKSFIAIETEIYAAKYKIYQPLHELRVFIP